MQDIIIIVRSVGTQLENHCSHKKFSDSIIDVRQENRHHFYPIFIAMLTSHRHLWQWYRWNRCDLLIESHNLQLYSLTNFRNQDRVENLITKSMHLELVACFAQWTAPQRLELYSILIKIQGWTYYFLLLLHCKISICLVIAAAKNI